MTVQVTGWGMDEDSSPVTSLPREVELPIVAKSQCTSDITAKTFCAGFLNGKFCSILPKINFKFVLLIRKKNGSPFHNLYYIDKIRNMYIS
jgi:hypothetical protein